MLTRTELFTGDRRNETIDEILKMKILHQIFQEFYSKNTEEEIKKSIEDNLYFFGAHDPDKLNGPCLRKNVNLKNEGEKDIMRKQINDIKKIGGIYPNLCNFNHSTYKTPMDNIKSYSTRISELFTKLIDEKSEQQKQREQQEQQKGGTIINKKYISKYNEFKNKYLQFKSTLFNLL